jgi:hypothetical protein
LSGAGLPDRTPFRHDSIYAAVSLLFRMLKLPKGELAPPQALALLAPAGRAMERESTKSVYRVPAALSVWTESGRLGS